MERMRPFIILVLAIVSSNLLSQNCGVYPDEHSEQRLKLNIELAKSIGIQKTGLITYLPIQFFIVSDNNGNGAIVEDRIFEALCLVNEQFQNLEIQFYLNGEFIYMNSSSLYNQGTNNSNFVQTIFQQKKLDETINVFIGGELTSGNSGYYSGGSDVIYMDKQYMNKFAPILGHELGHFFSLRHTFWGWEDTTYDSEEATPTTVYIGNNPHEVEFVSREKNCAVAGDLMCDTPADYILSGASNCNYTGGAVDPDEELIDPDEKNIMAYYSFSGCSEYYFSNDQILAILADISVRSEFANLSEVNTSEITEVPELIMPINEEEVPHNDVQLIWEEVENADFYKVEISRLNSFNVVHETIFTSDTQVVINELLEDRKYYWRVSAYSKANFCQFNYSDEQSFLTVMSTPTLGILQNRALSIYPNPNQRGNLFIGNIKRNRSYSYRIFNKLNQELISSTQLVENEIDLSGFKPGVYFIEIKSAKDFHVKKLIINQ